jgi:putative FmdB family regulatory protein
MTAFDGYIGGMPIYEYQCARCGTFEVSQRITDAPLASCPKCRGKVTKLISQSSFQLKGSGWYVTDYAGKGDGKKEPSAKGESKADGSPGEKSSGKSEAAAT